MQCGRCGFENLPGFTACVRCGSVLAATAGLNVHPPRAKVQGLRPIGYRANRLLEIYRNATAALDRRTEEKLGGLRDTLWMFLSAVPGVAHLLTGRLYSIRLAWPAWFFFLMVGAACWGTHGGSIGLGVAFSLHAWIAMNAGRVRRTFEIGRGRLLGLICLLIAIGWGMYGSLPRFWVRGVFATKPVAEEGIKNGDFVLVWKQAYDHEEPRRGDLVLYQTFRGHAYWGEAYGYENLGGDVLGKLLAYAGEEVSLGGGFMRIKSKGATERWYEVPGDYKMVSLSFVVPEGRYFTYPVNLSVKESTGGRVLDGLERWIGQTAIGKAITHQYGQDTLTTEEMKGIDPANVNTPEWNIEGMPANEKLLIMRFMAMPYRKQIYGRAGMIYNTWWNRRPLPRIPLEPVENPQS